MVWEMQNWPNPDSAEMGFFVDQWLVSLREGGITTRQLAVHVRRLAVVVNREWVARTPAERAVISEFEAWLTHHESIPTGTDREAWLPTVDYSDGDVIDSPFKAR